VGQGRHCIAHTIPLMLDSCAMIHMYGHTSPESSVPPGSSTCSSPCSNSYSCNPQHLIKNSPHLQKPQLPLHHPSSSLCPHIPMLRPPNPSPLSSSLYPHPTLPHSPSPPAPCDTPHLQGGLHPLLLPAPRVHRHGPGCPVPGQPCGQPAGGQCSTGGACLGVPGGGRGRGEQLRGSGGRARRETGKGRAAQLQGGKVGGAKGVVSSSGAGGGADEQLRGSRDVVSSSGVGLARVEWTVGRGG
jgi:hypothetical protein